eukprot:5747208-Amphidinium_carterae.1
MLEGPTDSLLLHLVRLPATVFVWVHVPQHRSAILSIFLFELARVCVQWSKSALFIFHPRDLFAEGIMVAAEISHETATLQTLAA